MTLALDLLRVDLARRDSNGKPCGKSHISKDDECHTGAGKVPKHLEDALLHIISSDDDTGEEASRRSLEIVNSGKFSDDELEQMDDLMSDEKYMNKLHKKAGVRVSDDDEDGRALDPNSFNDPDLDKMFAEIMEGEKRLAQRERKRKDSRNKTRGDSGDLALKLLLLDLNTRHDTAIARTKTINGTTYNLNKNSRWERVKHGVQHGAVHLGENVAAWKVGKVVGGAIAQIAASHGADPEVAKLLSETAVQALASTALYARNGKRSSTDIATHLIAQSAAAFLGKVSHGGVDEVASSLGGSEHVTAISALVAGKLTGIGTVVAAHRTGIARKLAESIPGSKRRLASLGIGAADVRGDARDGMVKPKLKRSEVANVADMVMMGYALAALPKTSRTDAFPAYKARTRTPAGTIGITHQPGDKRFGRPMMASYGHLQGTYGQAEDGKSWDFYLGDEPDNEDLYEVLQTTATGMPDERKFITHCRDMDHAREVFVSHAGADRFGYIQPKGWDFFG